MGNRHVLFPACTEGKKDEEAKVTECITVLLLVWRISTKTSFWFKSVGCVGELAERLWLMYSGGRSVDSNSWSSVLVIFETFDLIGTEN